MLRMGRRGLSSTRQCRTQRKIPPLPPAPLGFESLLSGIVKPLCDFAGSVYCARTDRWRDGDLIGANLIQISLNINESGEPFLRVQVFPLHFKDDSVIVDALFRGYFYHANLLCVPLSN
jgi:hypothetical protein